MKCERARELMLLAQSGEGSPRQVRGLTAHMEACTACRTYSIDLQQLVTDAREAMSLREPSPAVITAIRDEAEAACIQPRAKHWWQPVYSRAVGLAASLTLIVGAWMYYQQPDKQDAAPDIKALLTMASGQPPETAVVQPPEVPPVDESFQRLGAVLLEMEGLAMEEWTVADSSMLEDLKELDESEPTDPL
jgi:hypothetical protein